MTDSRVIVALDYPHADAALGFCELVTPRDCRLKVGKELFVAAGPAFVEKLVRRGFDVFLDLKFHDIPNTVANACKAAAGLGVWMLNVHALGGRAMLEAARAALPDGHARPKLIAVTVLTSLTGRDLAEVGIGGDPAAAALKLAALARSCGLDGVVCSAQEAALFERELGAEFWLVTPGIRRALSADDDQRRVLTPSAAIAAGADYLVIGRPVTRAEDPRAALDAINADVAAALQAKHEG